MIRSPFSHPNRIFSSGFYNDADLDFEVRTTLGKVTSGAADTGEICLRSRRSMREFSGERRNEL